MIKGAQKRLIVVKTTGSPFFDEAYFVLRNEATGSGKVKRDMLSEANRILRDSTLSPTPERRRRRAGLRFFLLGFFGGAAASAFILLFFLL